MPTFGATSDSGFWGSKSTHDQSQVTVREVWGSVTGWYRYTQVSVRSSLVIMIRGRSRSISQIAPRMRSLLTRNHSRDCYQCHYYHCLNSLVFLHCPYVVVALVPLSARFCPPDPIDTGQYRYWCPIGLGVGPMNSWASGMVGSIPRLVTVVHYHFPLKASGFDALNLSVNF